MKCRQCESEVAQAENFCPTCGKPALLENPEITRHRGGIFIGRVLVLLVAVTSGAGAMLGVDPGTIDREIAELTALKNDPKYDPGKLEGKLAELRNTQDQSHYITILMGSVGILFAALFVFSLYKPFPAFVGAAVLLGAAPFALLRAAPPEAALLPLVVAGGVLYGAWAARKKAIAVEESRAKTQPKPIVRTETRPPRPESPPSA